MPLDKLKFSISNNNKHICIISGEKWPKRMKNIFKIKEKPTKQEDREISSSISDFSISCNKLFEGKKLRKGLLFLVPEVQSMVTLLSVFGESIMGKETQWSRTGDFKAVVMQRKWNNKKWWKLEVVPNVYYWWHNSSS